MRAISQDCAIFFTGQNGTLESWLSQDCYISFSRGINCYFNIKVNQYHYISQREKENQPPDFMGHLLKYPSTERKLFFKLKGLRMYLGTLSEKQWLMIDKSMGFGD